MRAFQQWCQHRIGWWLLGLIVCVAMPELTSCTTILSPNPQPVAVNSSPPQATVLVNGSPMGSTPTTVNLDRKLTYTLELQKPGSVPYAQMLTKTVDPIFFLNILFLPGFLVDLATGTWKQFLDQVMAPMVPLSANRR
jgi:PEGA domain-containing protein